MNQYNKMTKKKKHLLQAHGSHTNKMQDLLGLAKQRMKEKKIYDALDLLDKGFRREPDNYHVVSYLAICYDLIDEIDNSINYFRIATKLRPDFWEGWHNLSKALIKNNVYDDETVEACVNVTVCDPEYADGWYLLGFTHHKKNHNENAIRYYKKALNIKKDHVASLKGIGDCLSLSSPKDAQLYFEKALSISPRDINVRISHIKNLTHQQEYSIAEREIKNILKYQKNHIDKSMLVELMSLDSVILMNTGKFHEAKAVFEQGLKDFPDQVAFGWNFSFLLFGMRDLSRAWEYYDKGLPPNKIRYDGALYPQPLWRGQDLSDKSILVYGEQGIGDEMLFASCMQEIIQLAKKVIIYCEPRLEPLFVRSFPDAAVRGGHRFEPISWIDEFETIDYQVPIGSLPRYLRPKIESFPKDNIYLKPESKRKAYWRKILDALGSGIKVGIAWRSRRQRKDHSQFVSMYPFLDNWLPVFSLKNIHFINLQYECTQEEINEIRDTYGVEINTFQSLDLLNDLDDLAALISELDCVIAPNMTVAVLANGAGSRLLYLTPQNLNHQNAIGLHMLSREGSPWFPTAQIVYPRTERGDWQDVFTQVAEILQGMLEDKGLATTKHSATDAATPFALSHTSHGPILYDSSDPWFATTYGKGQIHAEEGLALILGLATAGSDVMVLGAGVGEFAIPLAKVVGAEGSVQAFEAERLQFLMLCGNAALNGLTQLYPYASYPVTVNPAETASEEIERTGETRPEAPSTQPWSGFEPGNLSLVVIGHSIPIAQHYAWLQSVLQRHLPIVCIERVEHDTPQEPTPGQPPVSTSPPETSEEAGTSTDALLAWLADQQYGHQMYSFTLQQPTAVSPTEPDPHGHPDKRYQVIVAYPIPRV